MTSTHELGQQIETLLNAHLAACHEVARAAVERAFAAAAHAPRTAKPRAAAAPSSRRSTEELAALSERFYAAVCETPGLPMTVLAARLGVPSRSLEKPVARLRRAGRVRGIGKRQLMRYFPRSGDDAMPWAPSEALALSMRKAA